MTPLTKTEKRVLFINRAVEKLSFYKLSNLTKTAMLIKEAWGGNLARGLMQGFGLNNPIAKGLSSILPASMKSTAHAVAPYVLPGLAGGTMGAIAGGEDNRLGGFLGGAALGAGARGLGRATGFGRATPKVLSAAARNAARGVPANTSRVMAAKNVNPTILAKDIDKIRNAPQVDMPWLNKEKAVTGISNNPLIQGARGKLKGRKGSVNVNQLGNAALTSGINIRQY